MNIQNLGCSQHTSNESWLVITCVRRVIPKHEAESDPTPVRHRFRMTDGAQVLPLVSENKNESTVLYLPARVRLNDMCINPEDLTVQVSKLTRVV